MIALVEHEIEQQKRDENEAMHIGCVNVYTEFMRVILDGVKYCFKDCGSMYLPLFCGLYDKGDWLQNGL